MWMVESETMDPALAVKVRLENLHKAVMERAKKRQELEGGGDEEVGDSRE